MVVKDQGGTNGVLPVSKALKDFGYDVRLIADGKAISLLADARENYEVLRSPQEVLRRYPAPQAMITSICSEGGVGRDLVPLIRGKCPTVAFHDYWGTRLLTGWRDLKYRPDFFVVNDELDAEIVSGAWPDYPKERLVISGYPMFDQYAVKYDQEIILAEVSSKLGIEARSKPIVLFPCGICSGASRLLSEVVGSLNELQQDVFFIPRVHPKMKQNAPEEVELWSQALRKFKGGTLIADSSACDTQSLIKTAAVVLSDFSTTLLEAILARKPNISIWYSDEVQREFRKEFGEITKLMPEPPFVKLGCSARATDKTHLGQLIADAICGRLKLESAQEKYFPLDGKNAQRAAEFVDSLIFNEMV